MATVHVAERESQGRPRVLVLVLVNACRVWTDGVFRVGFQACRIRESDLEQCLSKMMRINVRIRLGLE